MKRIIFIEGVSGTGKSTTVRLLGQKLRNLGFSVNCHFEGDSDGPLDLCWVAYLKNEEYAEILANYPSYAGELSQNILYRDEYTLLRYQVDRTELYSKELHAELHEKEFWYKPTHTVPLKKFTEVFLKRWYHYSTSAEAECDYAVFDASLVSHMSNDLTRNYNATQDEAATHVTALLQAVNSLNPIVFYLSSQNVRERLIKARESRGQAPLNDQQIEFWVKRKQMDIAMLSRLPAETHLFDISDGRWNSAVSQMQSLVTEIRHW